MLLQDRTEKIKKLALCALFLAASVIISIVEGISGINSLIPLPGVRLGFCNIAVTACLYLVSPYGAFAISVVRPLFLFVFSGNPVSLIMSLGGSLMALLSLLLTKRLYGNLFSFCGVSCISAVCHSIGQTLCAILIMEDTALLLYLPLFAAVSSIAGTVSGAVMNIIIPRISGKVRG